MDKASILSDAISYVRDLQHRVGSLQAEILELQSTSADQQPIKNCKQRSGVGDAGIITAGLIESVKQYGAHVHHNRLQAVDLMRSLIDRSKSGESINQIKFSK
jgi:hypothetical protein